MEHTQNAIWSVDKNYRILTTNRLFREFIFNTYKIDLKVGNNALEQFGLDTSATWKDIYDSTFDGVPVRKEWEILNQEGNLIYYEILTSPIYSSTGNSRISYPKDQASLSDFLCDEGSKNVGEILGATLYIRDITEKKVLEQKTANLIKSKNRLLTTVVHDLKNPINGILGLIELLKEQTDNQNSTGLLNMISRAANKSLNIIQDLLQIAEMENENFKLKTEKTNLNYLIESLVKQN